MTEIPEDMHAKGHVCKAAFKAHGKGGFHNLVRSVMKRPKLTEEGFKMRKFQVQTLNISKKLSGMQVVCMALLLFKSLWYQMNFHQKI